MPAGLGTVDVRLASSGLSDPLGVSDYSGRNLKRETLGYLPKYACWCVRDWLKKPPHGTGTSVVFQAGQVGHGCVHTYPHVITDRFL